MEYCEGKTLRDLIDNDLYEDVDKVWFLFREILHVHVANYGLIALLHVIMCLVCIGSGVMLERTVLFNCKLK